MKKVLAFDCGGTNTRLALINNKYKIEKVLVTPTITKDKKAWVKNIVSMIEKFPLKDVVAISFGLPGVCDRKNGVILDLPNVFISNIKIRKILKEKFNLPVFIRNDAEVACLGEAHLGAGKGFSRVFFITISTGLGGALCVDGFNQDYVTEIGHTAYVYKGHVSEYEKLVSGLNLHNLAKINKISNVKSAPEMFQGVRDKDPKITKLFNEWFKILGDFIEMINSSYKPEIICVTGGLTKSKDLFLDKLAKKYDESIITECKFSEDAGLMGAAVYGFQSIK